MPNHVHVIAVPTDAAGLGKLFGTVHQRYARRVNATNSWSGHLWQERFYSVVMDERHALAAMRYVEMNPVRAGLCDVADQWPWSSVHGHLRANYDDVLDSCFTQQLIPDWRSFLAMDEPRGWADSLRAQTSSGRPCGADHFIEAIERKTGRRVRRIKPGPLPKN